MDGDRRNDERVREADPVFPVPKMDQMGTVPVARQPTDRLPSTARPLPRLSSVARNEVASGHPSWGRVRRALGCDLSRERGQGLFFLLIPVALGVGAGFALWTDQPAGFAPVAIALSGLLILAYALRNHAPDRSRLCVLGGMVCVGALAALLEEARGPVLLDSAVVTTLTGTVEAREETVGGRVRYRITLEATENPEIRRAPRMVRVTARADGKVLVPGTRLTGRARLAPPSGPALSGGYDFAYQAFFDGIGAYGFFFEAPRVLDAAPALATTQTDRLKRAIRHIRETVSTRIRNVLPGDAGGIAAALTVSDRSGISEETVEALRATGLAHILAISGLHMALAAGTLYVTLRRILALSRRLSA